MGTKFLGAQAPTFPLFSSANVSNPAAGGRWYSPDASSLIIKNSSGTNRSVGMTDVRCATTAAGTLASSFENGDSIDGVTLATGDWILIKDQAAPADNGVYIVNASGAPTRAPGFETAIGAASSDLVAVYSGTANGGQLWTTTFKSTDTLGTTAMRWYRVIDDRQLNHGIATRSITSGQSFTAVTSEQVLQAWTIPANTLQVGTTIRLTAECYATQTAVASNMTLRARIGAVAGGTGNALAAQSGWSLALARTNIPFTVVANLTCRSTGGSGTMIGGINFYGEYTTGATNASAAAVTAAITVDTTADRDVLLTLQPSVTTITAVNIVTNTYEVVVA